MPVFGNRMVVGTANYKHVREHQAEVDERETKLGEWEQEKRERLDRIRQLNENTKVRLMPLHKYDSLQRNDVNDIYQYL